jgi:hypothetical protein
MKNFKETNKNILSEICKNCPDREACLKAYMNDENFECCNL